MNLLRRTCNQLNNPLCEKIIEEIYYNLLNLSAALHTQPLFKSIHLEASGSGQQQDKIWFDDDDEIKF
jgi:hypothetical protein